MRRILTGTLLLNDDIQVKKSYVEIHKASDKGKKGGVTTLYIAEMCFITLKGQREVIPEIVGVRH
jgi:hypothetical protein